MVENKIFCDNEIQDKLNSMKKKRKYLFLCFFIFLLSCMAIGIWTSIEQKNGGYVSGSYVILILILFVLAAISFILLYKIDRKRKKLISENISKALLGEVFEVEKYTYDGYLAETTIKNMGFIGGWNKINGSDHVVGKYKGYDIEFSDVELIKVTHSRDSNGNSSSNETRVFRGPWIIMEHDRELTSDLRIREKILFANKITSDIETENSAFNDKFQILTEDGHTAFLILTPNFMESITSVDKKGRGTTYMRFYDNKLCIAIYNDKDAFESSSRALGDMSLLREEQRSEIKYITDILDELMENDYLFKKGRNNS